jgi:hypothetical protein
MAEAAHGNGPEDRRPESGVSSFKRYLDGADTGPTVLRIVLGSQLRSLRQACEISREDAGKAIRASHAKISRMELGRVRVKERDLADLLDLYGIRGEAERADYFAMARQAMQPGWWHRYSDVIEEWFVPHIGLEEAASVIRSYEVQFLPGLLQTEDYARAVVRLGHPEAPQVRIDRLVELRMARQRLLRQPDAPRLWAIIDEATVRRPFGGDDAMRAQLEHLLHVADLPHVTLQVARFGAATHAAAGTPITILRFPEPDLPDVVYLEQLTSAVYLEKQDDVDRYALVMERLCTAAETPRETTRFLRDLLDGRA